MSTHFCRSELVVFYDEFTVLVRDPDIFIAHMSKRMLQHAIEISILRHHIEQSVAREARHSTGISALLVHLWLLLVMVAAGYRLAAFVRLPDSSVCMGIFLPVSNLIAGALAIIPQVKTSHT